MRIVLLMVALALNAPGGHATTTHHGIEVYNGTIAAPLSCDNNSGMDAVVYYNHQKYSCPKWALTEVQ